MRRAQEHALATIYDTIAFPKLPSQKIYKIWDLISQPLTPLNKFHEELRARLASLFLFTLSLLLFIFMPFVMRDHSEIFVLRCITGIVFVLYILGRIGFWKLASALLIIISFIISFGVILVNSRNSSYTSLHFIKDMGSVFATISLTQFLLPTPILVAVTILILIMILICFMTIPVITVDALVRMFGLVLSVGVVNISGSIILNHYRSYIERQLVSTISHELRTPLHAIIGATELLVDNPDSNIDDHKELLNTVLYSGRDMLALVNDILDCSKLKAGELTISAHPFDLLEKLNEIITSVQHLAKMKNLELKLILEDDLPAQVIGDYRRIKQVLLNFLTNGIKFTEKGYVRLKVKCKKDSKNFVKLSFMVEDSGIGISPENQKKLFHRFMQLNHDKPGTGLGLVICKDLVELMGGSVSVNSIQGKGSTFTANIRVKVHQWLPDKPKDLSIAKTSPEEFKLPTVFTILLAEDNTTIQKLTAKLLSSMNCKFEIAQNGKECVEMYCNNHETYDAILMDVKMPELDGRRATLKIRAIEKERNWKPVWIIGLSANDSHDSSEMCKQCGMNSFLGKPFSKLELYNRLKELALRKK